MKRDLSLKELLVTGGGLFSMHFGAGCLLYPVTWGADAGSAVYAAFAGVFLSGAALPFLGYLALARGRGDFLDLIRRASPRFGRAFVAVLILVLGPLFMLPRVTAALWAGIVQLAGLKTGTAAGAAFSVAVYALAFAFVSDPGKVAGRVGRVLFPALLCVVGAVIARGVLAPLAPRVPPVFTQNPVLHGFLAAYAVGDLQCALVYGLVIVRGIESAGVAPERVSRNLLCAAAVGLGLLAAAHLGHMIAGANTGGAIRLNLSATYVRMVVEQWGRAGGAIFLAALATASLTATIGIASSTSALWERLLDGRVSYRAACLLTCAVSCAVSTAGIDAIVRLISPLIDACYPATIVLAAFYAAARPPYAPRALRALRASLMTAAALGAAGALHSWVALLGLDAPVFESLYAALPLSSYSMSWVPFAPAAFAISWATGARRAAKDSGRRGQEARARNGAL